MLDRVSDTKNHTPPEREEEAQAKFMAAQDEFRTAFMRYVDAAIEYGSITGWQQGFDRGWDAAFEYIKTPMGDVKMTAIRNYRPERPVQPPLPFLSLGADAELTAADLVYEFIKSNPGKRGVEIATVFEARTPPIPERTVRTALHRLRHQAEKIKNIDGKWYAADYQPPLRRI
jgi:hypothetical protein